MARSKTYMNWTGVTISFGLTPTVIALSEVVDIQILDEEGIEMWQADGHKYATQAIAASGAQGLTIIGGDVGKLLTIPRNTPCTVVAILNDSVNGTGSGALTHTLVNAILSGVPRSNQSNKFGGGSVTFVSFSSNGTTPPLTVVEAA